MELLDQAHLIQLLAQPLPMRQAVQLLLVEQQRAAQTQVMVDKLCEVAQLQERRVDLEL
jgi:hypothetical protein